MRKKMFTVLMAGVLSALTLVGCGGSGTETPAAETAPAETAASVETAVPAKTEAPAKTSSTGFTFEDLQDNYVELVNAYNEVEKLYMDDAIAQSDEVEELLTEAKGLIDEIGELSEDDFSNEDDLLQINNAMVDILNGLNGVIDKMEASDTAAASDSSNADDITYVDGFYANDGASDFMIAFFEGSAGDVAYVNDGKNEAFAQYTVEEATTDEGDAYLLVTVGGTQLGYVEDGDDIYLIDDEGNAYTAARLTEAEAEELYNMVTK